ncbi:MAG: hypothetical protein ACM3H8_08880, partial [Sphingobacteriales bacterium]
YRKKLQLVYFGKMELLLSAKPDYDIVFFGNSRTHFGINPFYVDSITELQSYNLGQGGSDTEEMLLYATLYLSHHKAPKYAVLNLDASSVLKPNRLKDRYSNLFFLDNDTVFNYMQRAGFNTTLIKHQPFLKYSFFDEYSRTSIFLNQQEVQKFDHNIYKGFANTHKELTRDTINWGKTKEFEPVTKMISEEKINDTTVSQLKKIVQLFLKKGSHVIIIHPPAIKPINIKGRRFINNADSIYADISKTYTIPVYDVNNTYTFPKKYFSDGSHLNEPGTKIFSKLLGYYLDSLNKQ